MALVLLWFMASQGRLNYIKMRVRIYTLRLSTVHKCHRVNYRDPNHPHFLLPFRCHVYSLLCADVAGLQVDFTSRSNV